MSEAAARKLLYERSGRVCERCRAARATEAHHRLNRSQRGLWVLSNLLDLDHECHAWVTGRPEASRELGGWSVRSFEVPAEVPVLLGLWGWSLLDDDGGINPTAPPSSVAGPPLGAYDLGCKAPDPGNTTEGHRPS